MQKLQDYWTERSLRQKAVLIAAFLTTFLMIAGFAWIANRPSMSLLYGGLDPAQAGEVVAGIERSGVPYEVRGDSIWVDSARRDKLRMDLAAEGLPAAGGAGYELLDGMSGFGTTSQMFDAAYWRAKEGELARTILALPNVKTARVHLAIQAGRGYRRDGEASASVTVTTTGQGIDRTQAAALKYLISSGVPGMSPDAVTVIDTRNGIVSAGEDSAGADRAAEMKRNVERILEPYVGIGNAIVELNLDVVTDTELLTEQRFDPEQRAMISQVTEETTDQSNSTGSGAVTAASNLPDSQAAQGDRSEANRQESRQQANYEVTRVTREVSRQPGSIRRLTVAVLVNGVPEENDQGETQLVPRQQAELDVLGALVASAVGFDEARGDQVTVKSLPFAGLGEGSTATAPGLLDRLALNDLARILLIGLFALAVVTLVLRPMLRGRSPKPLLDDSRPLAETPALAGPVLTGTVLSDAEAQPAEAPTPGSTRSPGPLALPPGDPVARLRNMMRERHDESVKILTGWIENKENAS